MELRRIARDQLGKYDTVEFRHARKRPTPPVFPTALQSACRTAPASLAGNSFWQQASSITSRKLRGSPGYMAEAYSIVPTAMAGSSAISRAASTDAVNMGEGLPWS
jgi:hypothetical protein